MKKIMYLLDCKEPDDLARIKKMNTPMYWTCYCASEEDTVVFSTDSTKEENSRATQMRFQYNLERDIRIFRIIFVE